MDIRNNSFGLATQCSCDNCDTLRCLTRKYGLLNDENNDTHSNKCVFITDIALTKPPFENAKVCKKELVFSDGLEIMKTKKAQCKYCRRYVESQDEINDLICSICKAYLPEDKKVKPWIFELCKNFIRPNINKITMQIPDSVKTKRIRCKYCRGYVDFHHEMIEPICNICKAYIPKENICNSKFRSNICKKSLECPNKGKERIETKEITKSIPTDCKHTVEAKYKVCERAIEDLETCRTFVCHKPKMTKINSNKSLCKHCKINAMRSECKHRKDKPLSPTEEMKTRVSKCKICPTGIKEFQAAVDKVIELGKDLEKHSCNVIHCRDCTMHSTSNEILAPEEMCTGKSNCKICRRFVDQWEETMSKRAATYKKIVPLCEFCQSDLEKKSSTDTVFNKKIKCNGCNNILSVVNTENTPSEETTEAKSLCPLYKKEDACKGKPEKLFTKKSNCAFCRRDIEDCQVHFGIITQDDKMCQFCQLNAQPQTKEIKLCDSVNNQYHKSKDIHPSTLKLSAQVMNLNYDEFKASLGQQISNANKSTMKSTLSNDITKRIKEAYRACSCKFCECVIGKSLTTSNVCSCKPCDCLDCKSFNYVSEPKSGHPYKVIPRSAINVQNQLCECTPCSCIRCRQIPKESTATAKPTSLPPGRSYIVATVSENQHAANCTCTTCHCEESLLSFFSLPTHVTHEMSTGIVRNCRCEQCVDQRCMGAGGTNECRCEMPSKPIFKPVEKVSHDYDIHRTAVCHQRNKKKDCHEPKAMYATVCSKYSKQKNVGEGYSCEARKCASFEGKNSKMSIKDTLINQLESRKYIQESGICSDVRNTLDSRLINYKNADRNCDKCDCVNCHITSKYMHAKSNPLTKSIGKIYYRYNENGRSTCKMPITENTLKNEDHTHYCSDTKIFTATTFTQDLSKNISPQYNVANKYFDYNLNKDVNNMNYRDQNNGHILKDFTNTQLQTKKCTSNYLSNEYPGTTVSNLFGLKHTNIEANNEYESTKVNLQPYNITLSNYKAECSKKTLETCLNDILTLDDELNLKMGSKMNKANISYSTTIFDCDNNQNVDDIDVYDYKFEPLSKINRNFYNKSNILGGVKIYKPKSKIICNEVELKKPNTICTFPSVVNGKNKVQIDYARVNNTLKEAKDFSAELLKLLDKYDKANRDFQSVSEKMKFSHDSNECKKLKDTVRFQFDYVVIGKQNNKYDNNLANSIKRVEDVVSLPDRLAIKDLKDSFGVIEKNLCTNNYATNKSLQNNVSLVEKDQESEQNKKIMSDINLVIVKHADNKDFNSHCKDINKLTSTEALVFNNGQKTSEVNSFMKRIEVKRTGESSCVYNTDTTNKDELNDYHIEKKESIRNSFATHIERAITYGDNTHNQTVILTDTSIESVIKDNDNIAFSPVNKTKIAFPSKDEDEISEDGSMNRTNFHLKNLDFDIPPYGLQVVKNESKEKNNSVSEYATLEHHSDKKHTDKDGVSEDRSMNRMNFHLNNIYFDIPQHGLPVVKNESKQKNNSVSEQATLEHDLNKKQKDKDDVSEDGSINRKSFLEFDIPQHGLLVVKSKPKEKNNLVSEQATLEHHSNRKHKDKDDISEDESMNRTNFHLNNLDFDIPPYGLLVVKNEPQERNNSVSEQATLEHHSNKKHKTEKVISLKSGWSLPRNKTTHVDKESDTRVDYLMGWNRYKIHNRKISGSTLRSGTDSDLDSESRFTELSPNRHSAISKTKCSCERLKVAFLGGRRVSDHTVMVKWSKPKDLKNVQGYELQVDGRTVQTMIDQSRSMAVVTCLPNSDNVLLTMKTILLDGTKSGHEPSVTIIYHPRSKKHKN